MSDAQIATHFRCQVHDVVLPLPQYLPHVREQHQGQPISITPVWQDA